MSANIYYSPDKFGLEIVHDWDRGEAWSFDTYLLYRDVETKKFYMLSDSGCSCPVPFEDMGRADLTPIKKQADITAYCSNLGVEVELEFLRAWKAAKKSSV